MAMVNNPGLKTGWFFSVTPVTTPKVDQAIGALIPVHQDTKRVVLVSEGITGDARNRVAGLNDSGLETTVINKEGKKLA